jgi:hypothetical protein
MTLNISKTYDQPACSPYTTIHKRLYRPRLAPLTREHKRCCSSDKAKEGCCILAGLPSLQEHTACVERVHLVVLFCFCDRQLVFSTQLLYNTELQAAALAIKVRSAGPRVETPHCPRVTAEPGFSRVFRGVRLGCGVHASLFQISWTHLFHLWHGCSACCCRYESQLPSDQTAWCDLSSSINSSQCLMQHSNTLKVADGNSFKRHTA